MPPPFEHTVCAADYAFPWDALIAAFKFHGRVELAAALAERLLAAVRASAAPPPQLVVPVPLAPARLAERGYNQAWELARRLAPALGADGTSPPAVAPGGQRAPGRARPRRRASATCAAPSWSTRAAVANCWAGAWRWSTT